MKTQRYLLHAKSASSSDIEFGLVADDFWQKRAASFSQNQQVVYIINCSQGLDGDGKRLIQRVLGDDEGGALYIGMASNVGRLVQLLLSIRDGNDGKSHAVGIRYRSNPRFRVAFPLELLRIRLLSCHDARALEASLLEEYESEFGELPPLNRSR